jgi:hypothetical protein
VLGNAALLGQLTGLTLATVMEAEAHLSSALHGCTGAVCALRVLQLYLERLGCNFVVSPHTPSHTQNGAAVECVVCRRCCESWSLAPACSLSPLGHSVGQPITQHCFLLPVLPRDLLQAIQKCALTQVTALAAINLARKAVLSPGFARFPPSVVAAACLVKARQGLGLAPSWPRTLHSMTGYTTAPGGPLQQCLELMSMLNLAAA